MPICDEETLASVINHAEQAGTDLAELELKRASEGFPESASTISAFSNGSGGSIVYGVSERDFQPVENFNPKIIQDGCAQAARNLVEPPVQADIRVISYKGSPLVVANIPEAPAHDKPVFVKKRGRIDGSFIRTGDGDHRMTLYEIDRLMENQNRASSHDVTIVAEADLEDLDQTILKPWIERVRGSLTRRNRSIDDETLLINRRVVARDEQGVLRPTVAGLMAMGSYPQKFFPRLNILFASYPSTRKGDRSASRRYDDMVNIDGPIPDMVVGALAVITRNIRHGAIVSGALREEILDYPVPAMREAIANALLHRDYSPEGCASPVRVELYPDRLEITNPGGLYGPLTISDLGHAGSTISRNQALSRILGDVHYDDGELAGHVVENLGTGLIIIHDELEAALMGPAHFQSSLSEFKITMRHRRMTKEEDVRYSKENTAQAIRDYFARHDSASTSEIMEVAGISRQTANSYIKAMLANQEIVAIGSKHSPKRRYARFMETS